MILHFLAHFTTDVQWLSQEYSVRLLPDSQYQEECMVVQFSIPGSYSAFNNGHDFVVVFGVPDKKNRYSASINAAFLPEGSDEHRHFLQNFVRTFREMSSEGQRQVIKIYDADLGIIKARISWERPMGLELLAADVKYVE